MPRRLPDRKPRHRSPLIRGSANADVLSPFPPPETRTSFWLSNAYASRGVSATGRRCAGVAPAATSLTSAAPRWNRKAVTPTNSSAAETATHTRSRKTGGLTPPRPASETC